jgi:hypothetical protein
VFFPKKSFLFKDEKKFAKIEVMIQTPEYAITQLERIDDKSYKVELNECYLGSTVVVDTVTNEVNHVQHTDDSDEENSSEEDEGGTRYFKSEL